MDYPEMLKTRSDFSAPREAHEEAATFLQERNADALMSWRNRWATHRTYPDTYSGFTARFYALYFDGARAAARKWLMHKQWHIANTVSNVAFLKRQAE